MMRTYSSRVIYRRRWASTINASILRIFRVIASPNVDNNACSIQRLTQHTQSRLLKLPLQYSQHKFLLLNWITLCDWMWKQRKQQRLRAFRLSLYTHHFPLLIWNKCYDESFHVQYLSSLVHVAFIALALL